MELVYNKTFDPRKQIHSCNVCKVPFSWNSESCYIERPCGTNGTFYDFVFKMCSNECFNNAKTPFIEQLGKQQGWSKKSASENWLTTIEINKKLVKS